MAELVSNLSALVLGMSRPKRLVCTGYLLCVAYCCAWIPWCLVTNTRDGHDRARLGYGWIWAGPQYPDSSITINWRSLRRKDTGTARLSDIEEFSEADRENWDSMSRYAVPDAAILALRIATLTLLFLATVTLAGITQRSCKIRNPRATREGAPNERLRSTVEQCDNNQTANEIGNGDTEEFLV